MMCDIATGRIGSAQFEQRMKNKFCKNEENKENLFVMILTGRKETNVLKK